MNIEGGNNPKNTAHVDENGRLAAFAVSLSEQQKAAEIGENFNVNTGQVTLMDANETPLFYVKNNGESLPLKVSRIFSTFLTSTGGAGNPMALRVYSNITGGTILTATDLEIFNFNFGSGEVIDAIVKLGATGVTWSGGQMPIEMLFTSDDIRQLTQFDHIILPRGSSMLVTCVPPTGNTSLIVEAGCNLFKKVSSVV